jgi:hypothetical protein
MFRELCGRAPDGAPGVMELASAGSQRGKNHRETQEIPVCKYPIIRQKFLPRAQQSGGV